MALPFRIVFDDENYQAHKAECPYCGKGVTVEKTYANELPGSTCRLVVRCRNKTCGRILRMGDAVEGVLSRNDELKR